MAGNLFLVSAQSILRVLFLKEIQTEFHDGLNGSEKNVRYYISTCIAIVRRALHPIFIISAISVISRCAWVYIMMLGMEKNTPYISWILDYSNRQYLYLFKTLADTIIDVLKTVPMLLTLACNDVLADDDICVKPASMISFMENLVRFYWVGFFTVMAGWFVLSRFVLDNVLAMLRYSGGITGEIIYRPIYITLIAYFLILFSLMYCNAKKIYIEHRSQ
jgi:hypothetical protein